MFQATCGTHYAGGPRGPRPFGPWFEKPGRGRTPRFAGRGFARGLVLGFAWALAAIPSGARGETGAVVPGTGIMIQHVFDNFEDSTWSYQLHNPKGSRENDHQMRYPRGESSNGYWFEGPERGQPDEVQVVPTPGGGIEGSFQALRLRTLNSGVPGHSNRKVEQDDLILNSVARIGSIPVSEVPSAVVRVYLPPVEQWERRTGPQFGFRIETVTSVWKTEESQGRNRFRSAQRYMAQEPYWPGIWVHLRTKETSRKPQDEAYLTVRGNRLGRDYEVKQIPLEQFGWWTFGISVSGDGQVHYYASPGVDNLTQADHLASQFPYSYRAERMQTMFFNVCNMNDGKTWSTPFVIDDPQLFVVQADRILARLEQQRKAESQRTARQQATPRKTGRR